MKLEGIHHVTAITGDAPNNVEFYAGVLGMRMVKRTVNQDDPTIYHLFYADQRGSPGADMTFFEYPGAPRGRAGDGMIHRVVWRVASRDALDFWERRLNREGVALERSEAALRFADPEGLDLEFVVDTSGDEPLIAEYPDIPLDFAIRASMACALTAARLRTASRSSSRRSDSHEIVTRPGRSRVGIVVRFIASTSHPERGGLFRGRGPCTTSRGRRRWTTTQGGVNASRRPAPRRRRSSTGFTSARSIFASRPACSSR